MKTIFMLFLLLIFTLPLRTQWELKTVNSGAGALTKRTYNYEFKVNEFKLKEKSSFPDNFPLQLGGEYGIGRREDSYGKTKVTAWGIFVDINLHKKKLFFTLEYGEIYNSHDKESSHDKVTYASLGLNIRVLKSKQHRIYIHFGIFPTFRTVIPISVISAKYLFSFNKYFGISIGPRFIYDPLNEDTYLFVLGGIQFFTN